MAHYFGYLGVLDTCKLNANQSAVCNGGAEVIPAASDCAHWRLRVFSPWLLHMFLERPCCCAARALTVSRASRARYGSVATCHPKTIHPRAVVQVFKAVGG